MFVFLRFISNWHDNGRRTWGHSMWVDPWGQVVACQAQQAACVVAELNMQGLRERRAQIPALNSASV
jgi:nitrilase